MKLYRSYKSMCDERGQNDVQNANTTVLELKIQYLRFHHDELVILTNFSRV